MKALVPLTAASTLDSKAPSHVKPDLLDVLKSKTAEINEICTVSGVAGASIAVIDHGETIFLHNFGHRDIADQQPMTSDTIVHIASLTKSFTGVCIHRLGAEGRLELDDLIQKHLPDAKSRDHVVASTATIADLLGHRTGLQGADNIWLGSDGELLIDREETVPVFNHLRPLTSIRSEFLYNNLGYALLGEIITKLTSQPYHVYLKETILDHLGLKRTLVSKDDPLPDNVSLAYSTLDNGEPYNVPLPGSSGSVAMGSAGGLLSTVDDLSTYYKALMRSWRKQSQANTPTQDAKSEKGAIFGDASWIFAPLQIMETPAFREKSYASGWARSQLPTTVGDIGTNTKLVDEMPLLAEGIDSRLALWHQGSLVGATSFVMLLPETESAVVVLTNTMALNDAADWIGQLLVETLLESPIQHNYVELASVSAHRSLKKYADLSHKVEEGRVSGGPSRPLNDYVGSYVGFGGIFRIDVAEEHGQLKILFQGRKSQEYGLEHHHDGFFTWFMSWNEQIKRARFIGFIPDVFFIRFNVEGDKVTSLNWVHNKAVPEGEDFVKK
ncbi:unnamed protein product [Penicillium glandicola]